MSDPALATKAPESDAMEDIPTNTPQPSTTGATTTAPGNSGSTTIPSAISATDFPAQSGPTMGEHCTSDRPLPSYLSTHNSSGTITTLNNIETYISKPADYPSTPAKLLLLLTGGTGIHSLNNQLQADRFASAGYLVVMPDQFAGDAAPGSGNRITSPDNSAVAEQYQTLPTTNAAPEQQQPPSNTSLIDRIKLGIADTAKSFMLDMWLARQTPEKVLPRLLSVVEAIQDEYADAIAHGGGIYGVGFCFGARYILILARGGEDGKGVQGHPGLGMGRGFDVGTLSAALPAMPAMPLSPSKVLSGMKFPGFGGGGGGGGSSDEAKKEGGDVEAGAATTTTTSTSEGMSTAQQQQQPSAAAEPTALESEPALPNPTNTPSAAPLLIKTAAIAHGTLITHADVLDLHPSVPVLCVAVENDPLFPEEILNTARKAWAGNQAECKIEVFGNGVPHGFAVLGEYEQEGIRREQERAWGLMRGWLDGH